MDFAVVQESSDPPSVGRLRRAFESCAFLTSHDAITLARNAYGILVRGLSQANAHVLVRALGAAGVAATVVEQSTMATLPAPSEEEGFRSEGRVMVNGEPWGRYIVMMVAAEPRSHRL